MVNVQYVSTLLCLSLLLTWFCNLSIAQYRVEDYYQPSYEEDWGKAFNQCFHEMDKAGHGTLILDGTKNYTFYSSAELPRYATGGKRIFTVQGNGAQLTAANDSVCIFNRIPHDQKEALNKMMRTRFAIRDITFKGGKKAINLGATYQSSIIGCNFVTQREAAVDIQFGLATSIVRCNSNNALKDNFVLRTGEDWGGGANNSQSNHSIIDHCRVYARSGSSTCFKVLASGGVVLRDIISEGSKNVEYSVYIDRQRSSTVRLCKIENLHLEHKPSKAGIFIQFTGVTTIDGVFYQLAYDGFKLIQTGEKTNHINLKNVPHYVSGTIIQQEYSGTGWVLENCNNNFFKPDNWRVKTGMNYSSRLPVHFRGTGYGPNVEKHY